MATLILTFFIGLFSLFLVYGAYLFFFAFTLWMAVDAAKQDRFWWVVFILGIPVIGGMVYYFTEKKHEYVKMPPHHIHKSETEEQHEQSPHKHHHKKEEDVTEKKEETVKEKTEDNKETKVEQ